MLNEEPPRKKILRNDKIVQDPNYNTLKNTFESCSFCDESLTQKKAKLLGCLHSICVTCLEKEVCHLNPDEKAHKKISCPKCRCLTPVLLLAKNNFISIEAKSDIDEKDTSKTCASCEDFDIEGVKYCTDCKEWLCNDCVAAHLRVKITKLHNLEDERPAVSFYSINPYIIHNI